MAYIMIIFNNSLWNLSLVYMSDHPWGVVINNVAFAEIQSSIYF